MAPPWIGKALYPAACQRDKGRTRPPMWTARPTACPPTRQGPDTKLGVRPLSCACSRAAGQLEHSDEWLWLPCRRVGDRMLYPYARPPRLRLINRRLARASRPSSRLAKTSQPAASWAPPNSLACWPVCGICRGTVGPTPAAGGGLAAVTPLLVTTGVSVAAAAGTMATGVSVAAAFVVTEVSVGATSVATGVSVGAALSGAEISVGTVVLNAAGRGAEVAGGGEVGTAASTVTAVAVLVFSTGVIVSVVAVAAASTGTLVEVSGSAVSAGTLVEVSGSAVSTGTLVEVSSGLVVVGTAVSVNAGAGTSVSVADAAVGVSTTGLGAVVAVLTTGMVVDVLCAPVAPAGALLSRTLMDVADATTPLLL